MVNHNSVIFYLFCVNKPTKDDKNWTIFTQSVGQSRSQHWSRLIQAILDLKELALSNSTSQASKIIPATQNKKNF